ADMMPALLTSTSILPASTSTFLTPASTDESSLTSNSTVMMPSFRRVSAASRFLPCVPRIEAYTVWPARNSVSAVSRPKPLLAPVIRIVLDILYSSSPLLQYLSSRFESFIISERCRSHCVLLFLIKVRSSGDSLIDFDIADPHFDAH